MKSFYTFSNNGIYQRDKKNLAIGKVKKGESIRSVALGLELINPTILRDTHEDESIKETYPQKNYLSEEEIYKKNINKSEEENIKLKAEIEY